MFNPQQLDAITARDARLLVAAAPGSGKTRVLTERMALLLTDGVGPGEILALTFTRAAAEEMRERLKGRLPDRRPSLWHELDVLTYHAWAAKTLRRYADRVGLIPNFVIYDEQDKADLILYAGRECGLCPAPGEKKKAGQFTSAKRLWQEADVRRRYYGLLREAQAVDYDGLEIFMLRLLAQPDVAEAIRSRRIHVLVDEAQDTSKEQQAILDALDPVNLFVVGDGAQSIYGFRGANVAGFTGLGARPKWRVIELPVNYRSLPPIVSAATSIGAAMAVPGLRQVAAREGGDAETLAELTADDTEALHAALVADLYGRLDAGTPWGGMAVLSPTWDLLDELSAALTEAEVPHVVARKQLAVWDSAAARWLVACLRVALNPHDHASLWHALNAFTPRVTLGWWAGVRSRAIGAGASVLAMACAGKEAPAIASVILSLHAELTEDPVTWPSFADSVIEWMGLELTLLHLDNKRAEFAEVAQALSTWRESRREAGQPDRIVDLLDWYSGRHVTEAADQAEQGDRVMLTTIHGAKGLEWPDVWVLGCEEGRLPRGADAAGEPIEEQRRAFYVAVTRGKDRVRMLWRRDRTRSRFIAEALGERAEEPDEEAPDLDATA